MSGAAWPRAEAQYQSLQKLLAEFNAHSARAPNHLLRPGSRPRGGAAARRWWRYAAAAVRRQLPGRSFNWQQLEKARRRRRPFTNPVCARMGGGGEGRHAPGLAWLRLAPVPRC